MNGDGYRFFHHLLHAIDNVTLTPFTPFVAGAGRGKSYALEYALDLLRSRDLTAIATATSLLLHSCTPGYMDKQYCALYMQQWTK